MTLVVLNFMGFMNGYGLVSALVQARVLNIQQIRQAFGLMLVLNGGLALAKLFLAGIAADYYGQPQLGRAPVCTHVTNAQLVCRLTLKQTITTKQRKNT